MNENIPLVDSTTSTDTIPVLQSPNAAVGHYKQIATPGAVRVEQQVATLEAEHEKPQSNINTSGVEAEDLMHGINSFWAIVTPVAITMIVASFVVVHYRSCTLQRSMSSYLVFDEDGTSSGGALFGESLVNALVIIGFVAILTFVMVLLYKYNCMKFLVGYIMLASAAILGFEGGQLMDAVLIDSFEWPVDWASFLYIMYNFAVVGVVAVFYQKGTPKVVQNGYLVMISVILAWQFSMWPEWTTWIFCSMFAVYDLCAVLTPCGPLKCLIGLIQEKQQPMPGLLYEADVRDGVGNRQAQAHAAAAFTNAADRQHLQQQGPEDPPPSQLLRPPPPPPPPTTTTSTTSPPTTVRHDAKSSTTNTVTSTPDTVSVVDVQPYPAVCGTLEEFAQELCAFYTRISPNDAWKASQAAERFFDKQDRMWPLMFHKYLVCSCVNGEPCEAQMEAETRARRRREQDDMAEDKTIKLGLGDFIFYSVLVGRAALFDFSTLVVSFLCIVMGLGGTLFLLSVLHKALPALPFSIFLATFYYFWARYTFIDYVDFVNGYPAAV